MLTYDMLTHAMLTHADVSAGGPAAKVALSLAGRRQQGDAGRDSVYVLYWYSSTCFTGTPVKQGQRPFAVCSLEMQVGTQFTCFTGTTVQILKY